MFTQDSYLKRKLLKSKGFYIQHGEWDEHEHESGGVFQGKQLLGVVSDGENHSGKQGGFGSTSRQEKLQSSSLKERLKMKPQARQKRSGIKRTCW